MVTKEKVPYGYIYRATNHINGKIYIGQTVTDRWREDKIPIEERWKEEVQEAYGKERRGEELRHVESAIVKYGPENFNLEEQDKAYSQEDLDEKETDWIKEHDSINPEIGYNMTEGGMGGRPSPEVIEKLNQIAKEKAKDPDWLNNVSKGVSEKYQNDPLKNGYYNKTFYQLETKRNKYQPLSL